jgi:hypothetical protein
MRLQTRPETPPPTTAPRSRRTAALRVGAALCCVLFAAVSCKKEVGPADRSVLVPPGGTATPIEGWLKVEGRDIVDGQGRTVRFLGVADGRMNPGNGNQPNECNQKWRQPRDSEYENVASFGFNVVRLGVTWANIEPVAPTVHPDGRVEHHWNEQYLTALDRAVEGFGSKGVAVILDMHQAGWSPAFNGRSDVRCEGSGMPVWMYPEAATQKRGDVKCNFFRNEAEEGADVRPLDGFEALWRMLAERYADDATVVAADMFNEPPTTCSGGDVADMYERIGKAIRDESPKILLVYEDNAWTGYSKEGFLLPRPLSLPNSVYSWHFYPDTWDLGKRALQDHVDRAREWNVPLWIGEFNAFHYATGAGYPEGWDDQVAELMAYFKSNGVSWTLWEYGHGRNSALVDKKGKVKPELLEALQQGF